MQSSLLFAPTLLSIVAISAAHAQSGMITQDVKIPRAPDLMAVFSVEPANGEEVRRQVEALLEQADPDRPLKLEERLGDSLLAARDETGTVRAWVDLRSGDAAIYPRLSREGTGERLEERELLDKARSYFEQLFPDDEGRLMVGAARTLRHVRARAGDRPEERRISAQLLYVSAQRQFAHLPMDGAGAYRVEGPGSRALLALDAHGRVQGLMRRWNVATRHELAMPEPGDVRERIQRQFESLRGQAEVQVQHVTLGYYDGGQGLIQPAYRYLARLTPRDPQGTPTHDSASHVFGYVPFASTQELIPSPAESGKLPDLAQPNPAATPGTAPLISVGRYVARDAAAGFSMNATEFWDALSTSPSRAMFQAGDYLYSEPALFTKYADYYIRRMHVALIEGHGFPGGFFTRDVLEPVSISEIPPPMDPASALDHWILHSCSVIATPDETLEWDKPWWSALAGRASVVGYHTPMYVNDGAGAAYGESLGLGAPPLGAWFHELASLNAYGDNPYGCSEHQLRALGRAAAIASCEAPALDISRASSLMSRASHRTDCLDLWWSSDSVARATKPLTVDPSTGGELCEVGGDGFAVTTTYVDSCADYECDAAEGGICGASCEEDECVQWSGCTP